MVAKDRNIVASNPFRHIDEIAACRYLIILTINIDGNEFRIVFYGCYHSATSSAVSVYCGKPESLPYLLRECRYSNKNATIRLVCFSIALTLNPSPSWRGTLMTGC